MTDLVEKLKALSDVDFEKVRVELEEMDYWCGEDWTAIPDEVERGLTDTKPHVRSTCAGHPSITLTPEQIERGLTDIEFIVRRSFTKRDFIPTPEQLERGLKDEDKEVREAMLVKAKQLSEVVLYSSKKSHPTSV